MHTAGFFANSVLLLEPADSHSVRSVAGLVRRAKLSEPLLAHLAVERAPCLANPTLHLVHCAAAWGKQALNRLQRNGTKLGCRSSTSNDVEQARRERSAQ